MDPDNRQQLEFEYGLELTGSGIKKLDYYLNYNLSFTFLLAASYFLSIVTPLLIIAAVVFSCYMLFVLIKNRKFGWISAYFIMIFLPYLFFAFFLPGFYSTGMANSIALGTFFLYCFLLKMTTREWVSAENARRDLYEMRRKKQLEMDLFNRRIQP